MFKIGDVRPDIGSAADPDALQRERGGGQDTSNKPLRLAKIFLTFL